MIVSVVTYEPIDLNFQTVRRARSHSVSERLANEPLLANIGLDEGRSGKRYGLEIYIVVEFPYLKLWNSPSSLIRLTVTTKLLFDYECQNGYQKG